MTEFQLSTGYCSRTEIFILQGKETEQKLCVGTYAAFVLLLYILTSLGAKINPQRLKAEVNSKGVSTKYVGSNIRARDFKRAQQPDDEEGCFCSWNYCGTTEDDNANNDSS